GGSPASRCPPRRGRRRRGSRRARAGGGGSTRSRRADTTTGRLGAGRRRRPRRGRARRRRARARRVRRRRGARSRGRGPTEGRAVPPRRGDGSGGLGFGLLGAGAPNSRVLGSGALVSLHLMKSLRLMLAWGTVSASQHPTAAPYDALLICSFGGPNRPDDVLP